MKKFYSFLLLLITVSVVAAIASYLTISLNQNCKMCIAAASAPPHDWLHSQLWKPWKHNMNSSENLSKNISCSQIENSLKSSSQKNKTPHACTRQSKKSTTIWESYKKPLLHMFLKCRNFFLLNNMRNYCFSPPMPCIL